MQRPIVWTIAGSDCSGGAGIQADVKTMHNLGVESCSVITAVTAQNSTGVLDINAVSDDVLLSQLQALHKDKSADVIKIGLLANKRQVELIADWIIKAKDTWPAEPRIVYDPVAVASTGSELTEEDILPHIKSKLLPLVDVLTPNANETQRLSGVYLIGWQSLPEAAEAFIKLGVGAVVIKGGHIDIDDQHCVDYAFDGENHYWLASPKIETEHSHGTGCTFASAVASLLAQRYLLRDAITVAKAFINQGLSQSAHWDGRYLPVWQGQWPTERQYFPRVICEGSQLAEQLDWQQNDDLARQSGFGFAPSDTQQLGLYPVVDSVEWIEYLLKAGINTLQIRLKNLSELELEQQIKQAIALGKQYQARLYINDHWQLAIKYQAYGVHLGQEDLDKADLTAIKQAGLHLGLSTHGYYEILRAAEYQPSYLAIGAIYPTKTKDMTGQIQGVDRLQKMVELLPEFPIVAIGGINLQRAPEVWQTGVGSIAVVTAITQASKPEQVIQAFQDLMQ